MGKQKKETKPKKETLLQRCRGKKISELPSADRNKLFHARMSRGEINATISSAKLIDDRSDKLKRAGRITTLPGK